MYGPFIGLEQVCGHIGGNLLRQSHWHCVTQLPHGLTPSAVKLITVWKGL
jgi:hypothetical protein